MQGERTERPRSRCGEKYREEEMSVALHCTFFAADGKSILWEGLAAGDRGKQREFKLSTPAGDVPADTRAVFKTGDGATVSILRSVSLLHALCPPGVIAPAPIVLACSDWSMCLQRGSAAGGGRQGVGQSRGAG